MNNELLMTFVLLNIINVVVQTAKSICTIKCKKGVAALVNAVAYGLYTIVIIYMVCDLPLWLKALIVALCNLVGVFTVKYIEEKMKKEKLWKIEVTVNTNVADLLHKDLLNIPHSYIKINSKYTLFNIYCNTQKESKTAGELVKNYNGKYFISENKGII